MKVTKRYMTRNDCYNARRKITQSGIMVHSTATPGAMAENLYSYWNQSYNAGETDVQVSVRAILDDSGILQYLPWDHRGWLCSSAAYNTHISFEICEPSGFKYVNNIMTGYDPVAHKELNRTSGHISLIP